MLLFDQFSNENDMLKNYNETTINNSHKQYPALSNYDGYLDPKFVNSINPYWLTFDPTTPTIHYTLGIIHGFIMITGCFGNALVLYMFIRCKSLRTPATILVMNLAISDFCMLVKSPVVIYNSFHFGPALGDFACRMYGFLGGLTGTVTIITLTAISIDRYCVVVNPLNPLRRPIKLRLRFIVLIVWIYSFIFSIIPALNIGITKYAPEGVLTSCSMDYLDKSINARIFMFVFYIFAWAIPFFIITYCYFYILKVVYTNKVTIQSSMDRNKTEMKLAIIVISVVCLWLAAWTPYSIIALIGITGYENILSPFGAMIPAIFCKTAACIDPYVYAATHPRFRLEFKRLFFGKQKKNVRFQTSMVTPSTRRFTIGETPPSIISSSLSSLSSPPHQDPVPIDAINSIVITSSNTAPTNNIYVNNHVNLDDENGDVDEDMKVVTKNINNNYINTMNNINSNNNNNNSLNHNNNNNNNNSNNININNRKNGIIHNKLNNKIKINNNNNMGNKKKLINGIAQREMSANNLHQESTTVENSNQNNNNNNSNNNNNGINLNINKL